MNSLLVEPLFSTKIADLYWEDETHKILVIKINNLEFKNLEHAKDLIEGLKKIQAEVKNINLLMDVSNQNCFGEEVRNYVTGAEGIYKYSNAVAIYSDDQFNPTTLLIYGLLKIIKTIKPTSLFHDRDEALKWLNSFYD